MLQVVKDIDSRDELIKLQVRIIAKLKAEIKELRERLVQHIGYDEDTAWACAALSLGITALEERILRLFYSREFSTTAQVYDWLYAERPDCNLPCGKIIHVKISHIRKKFPQLGIETVCARGYRLPPAGKTWLKAVLEIGL